MPYYRGEYYLDDDPPDYRERPSGDMEGASWRETTAAARAFLKDQDVRTPGQKKRERRNLVILLCHKAGLSEHFIADAFNLARSRVNAIIVETKKLAGKR